MTARPIPHALVATLLALPIAACMPSAPADFNSPEPAARNAAIVQAARTEDAAAVPDLVRMLESDDPATRVLAIGTLERLTGQRLGYDPQGSPMERRKAVQAWREWAEAHPDGQPR